MERYEELWIEVILFGGTDVMTDVIADSNTKDDEGEQKGE